MVCALRDHVVVNGGNRNDAYPSPPQDYAGLSAAYTGFRFDKKICPTKRCGGQRDDDKTVRKSRQRYVIGMMPNLNIRGTFREYSETGWSF